MADPMTNFYQGASLGLMPQVRMSEDLGRSFTPIQTQSPYFVDPYRTGDQVTKKHLQNFMKQNMQDYLNRFLPVQQQLISEVSEDFPRLRQEEITRAQQAVARSYASISGQQRRRLGGFGLRESDSFYRDLERSQVSATVAARNLAGMRADERRSLLLSGNIGGAMGNRAVATQGGIGG